MPPDAERPPAVQPEGVQIAGRRITPKRRANLSLPPALEERVSRLELAIDAMQCVMACRGESCPVRCVTPNEVAE